MPPPLKALSWLYDPVHPILALWPVSSPTISSCRLPLPPAVPHGPRCATYNFLWSFAAYRSDSMIGIYNNLRSECRFTARSPPRLQRGWRVSGFALSGFHIVPDYRRPRNENPIIESQRFSFLPRYLCYRGGKKTAISTLLLLRFLMIGVVVLLRMELIFCFAYLKKIARNWYSFKIWKKYKSSWWLGIDYLIIKQSELAI